jgi:dCMP deaminase
MEGSKAERLSWDEYFLEIARVVAKRSPDRSTQVGCVIVGQDHEVKSTGYNGFPRGVDDENDDWHARPKKYDVTEHSERNAIYLAAKNGVSTNGCTMYCTWMPCPDCARAIIQCGITKVILDKDFKPTEETKDRWEEKHKISEELFDAAGTEISYR